MADRLRSRHLIFPARVRPQGPGPVRLFPGCIEAGKVAIGRGIFRPPHAVAILHHGRTATRLPGSAPLVFGLLLLRRERRRGTNDALAVDGEACRLARAGSGSRGGGSCLDGVRGSRCPRRCGGIGGASVVHRERYFWCSSSSRSWRGACAGVCAEAAATPAAAKSTITAILRIFIEPAKRARTFRSLRARILRRGKAGWLPRPQGDLSNSSDAGPSRPLHPGANAGLLSSRLVRSDPHRCLPKLAPFSSPMNAAGAPSRPSVTNSLCLTLPSRTQPDMSRRKSPWRAAKSLTMKPRMVRRLVSTLRIIADAHFGAVASVSL